MEKDSSWLIIAITVLLIITGGIMLYMSAEKEAQQKQRAQAERHSLIAHIEAQRAEIARLRAMVEEKRDK